MISGKTSSGRDRSIDWIGIVSVVVGLTILLAALTGWRW